MKPNVPHGHFDGIGIVSSAAVACAVGACLLVPRVAYAQTRLTNHLMGNSSEISRFYPVFSDNRAPQRNIPENQVPENLRIVPKSGERVQYFEIEAQTYYYPIATLNNPGNFDPTTPLVKQYYDEGMREFIEDMDGYSDDDYGQYSPYLFSVIAKNHNFVFENDEEKNSLSDKFYKFVQEKGIDNFAIGDSFDLKPAQLGIKATITKQDGTSEDRIIKTAVEGITLVNNISHIELPKIYKIASENDRKYALSEVPEDITSDSGWQYLKFELAAGKIPFGSVIYKTEGFSEAVFDGITWGNIRAGAVPTGSESAVQIIQPGEDKSELLKDEIGLSLPYIRYVAMQKSSTKPTKEGLEVSGSRTDYLLAAKEESSVVLKRWAVVLNKKKVKKEIEFETITRPNPQMKKGTQKVVQEGVKGTKTITEVYDVDMATLQVKDTIRSTVDTPDPSDKKPTPKIIEVGTKEVIPAKPIEDIATKVTKKEVEIPFSVEERKTNKLYEGETNTIQEGKVGKKIVTTTTIGSGAPQITEEIVVRPTPKIIEVGTKKSVPAKPIEDIATKVTKKEVEIPFSVEERKTNKLYEGETNTIQEGKVGKKIVTTTTIGSGAPQITEEIIVRPTPKIIEVGTKKRSTPGTLPVEPGENLYPPTPQHETPVTPSYPIPQEGTTAPQQHDPLNPQSNHSGSRIHTSKIKRTLIPQTGDTINMSWAHIAAGVSITLGGIALRRRGKKDGLAQ